jgi:hypothetical protein
MTLVVVRDRQEIYDKVNQARESSPQRPAARISVSAPGLDEQVRNDLQSEIQAVLDRTLQRARSARPTAGTEPPSDDQIREMIRAQRAQLGSPPAPAPEPRQRPQRNGGIRVDTSGLKLAQEDRRAFQSEVRQLVQERLAGMSPDLGRRSVTVCGCGWLFNCCWPPAGTLGDLTAIDPLPLPSFERDPIKVALYFGRHHQDAILFQIWTDRLLARNQIMVGLRIDPTQDPDQWAKEVTGWQICNCATQTDHVENTPPNNYNWMLIDQSMVDTLAFRKAIFASWNNSGYLGPTPAEFWNLLGGTTLTFDWISDGS